MDTQEDQPHKLVLLGDTAVGKTSCVERFVKDGFFEFQQPTIGACFLTQTVALETHVVKFEIWDTAGQERYRSLAPMYYRGASAALVVYDISSPSTLAVAKCCIEEIKEKGTNDEIILALAGNKVDMETRRKVPTAEAQEYATNNGLIFMEISAKTGANVREIFESIARKCPRIAAQPTLQVLPATRKGLCCK